MNREKIEHIKEMTCRALERVDDSDLKTCEGASMAKNLASLYLKLEEMGQGGYSQGGGWDARGYYGDPMSERGMRYSREGGYREYGGSSYHGDKEALMEQLEQMMRESGSPQERSTIQKFMVQMKNMK